MLFLSLFLLVIYFILYWLVIELVRKRILNYRMDDISFGRSDQLSVPQYHFKIIVIAFRLLV